MSEFLTAAVAGLFLLAPTELPQGTEDGEPARFAVAGMDEVEDSDETWAAAVISHKMCSQGISKKLKQIIQNSLANYIGRCSNEGYT